MGELNNTGGRQVNPEARDILEMPCNAALSATHGLL
jgi:hypothetical protein